MTELTLVINSGSSSLKFGLFRCVDESKKPNMETLCRGCLDGSGSTPAFHLEKATPGSIPAEAVQAVKNLHFSSIEEAHQVLACWLKRFLSAADVTTVCYRVVHGGDRYDRPVEIDRAVLQHIEDLTPLAPLHQPQGLNAINLFKANFPHATHIACFDTAFHRTLPPVAQHFAIPKQLTAQGIKPYGFHGLSYQFIADKLADLNQGAIPHRVVVAHLGSGASLCALNEGISIATTMTFTPLDGLPMATRCGAIDAGAVLYMAQKLKLSPEEISHLLYKESGLKGISGISGDVRELLRSDTKEARFALAFFVYRINRELGALIGLLQGLDTLVFTGGVGANSGWVREQVCAQLSWLGLTIDVEANRANQPVISAADSPICVYSLQTDEELMMAKLAQEICQKPRSQQ